MLWTLHVYNKSTIDREKSREKIFIRFRSINKLVYVRIQLWCGWQPHQNRTAEHSSNKVCKLSQWYGVFFVAGQSTYRAHTHNIFVKCKALQRRVKYVIKAFFMDKENHSNNNNSKIISQLPQTSRLNFHNNKISDCA